MGSSRANSKPEIKQETATYKKKATKKKECNVRHGMAACKENVNTKNAVRIQAQICLGTACVLLVVS